MRADSRTALKLLAILALTASASGCSWFRHRGPSIDTMPVSQLYATAHDALENADYGAATKDYQRLIARFPSGPYNEQAQLELAYSQYKDGQPDDSYSTINRFIKANPANPHVDYAYYLRGLINFNRSAGVIQRVLYHEDATAERDQAYNLQSFDDFAELSRRFPDSAYAADARQRMIYLRNTMARHEIYVAEFYLRHEAYIAAADRAQYVIEHYQQAPQAGDALAILTRCYLMLNEPELAKQTRKVLALNYPDHPYLKDPKWPHAPSTLRKMIPFSGHQ